MIREKNGHVEVQIKKGTDKLDRHSEKFDNHRLNMEGELEEVEKKLRSAMIIHDAIQM